MEIWAARPWDLGPTTAPVPAEFTILVDYELLQIINWYSTSLRLSCWYSIYDMYGRHQRLVTLGLLLAALRNVFGARPTGSCCQG